MPAVCRVSHRVVLRKELHPVVVIDFIGHLNLIELGHTEDVLGNRANGMCAEPGRRSCGLQHDRQKKQPGHVERAEQCTAAMGATGGGGFVISWSSTGQDGDARGELRKTF